MDGLDGMINEVKWSINLKQNSPAQASSVQGKKKSLATDYILRVLGLDVCAETLVGSDMVRGVSGGQRKRVTTGEMVVGPRKTLFMDEISTGLDSSIAYQILKCIRSFAHKMEGTVLMALLRATPETFDLFDDIILLSEGHIIYQGGRERVLDFFESLGFKLPPRKGVADFLQEVTSKKDQGQYWFDHSKPYVFLPVSEIADAFKRSQCLTTFLLESSRILFFKYLLKGMQSSEHRLHSWRCCIYWA